MKYWQVALLNALIRNANIVRCILSRSLDLTHSVIHQYIEHRAVVWGLLLEIDRQSN